MMKFNLDGFKAFPNQPYLRKSSLNITRHFEFNSEAVFEVVSVSIMLFLYLLYSVHSVEVFLGLVISNEYASGRVRKAVEDFIQYNN